LAAAGAMGAGCGGDCCTVDSLPIPLVRAAVGGGGATPGALVALATSPAVKGGAPFPMVLDTGSPVTMLDDPAAQGELRIQRQAFNLLDATAPAPAPLRAEFRDISLLRLPLGPVGDAGTQPLGVFGGDLLRAFSVELRFATSS